MANVMQNRIEKQAAKAAALHPIAHEWQGAIIAAILAKIVTAVCSVFAGFEFFNTKLNGLVPAFLIPVISILLLGLLELINLSIMGKGFKFAFRKRVLVATVTLTLSLLIYLCSFYISTQGIALYKINNSSVELSVNYSEQKQLLKSDLGTELAQIDSLIAPLAAYSWQGARVERYQNRATELKERYRQELAAIEAKEQAEIAVFKQTTEAKAAEFYNYVAVIMFVQLLANGALIGFYTAIYRQTKAGDYISEEVKALRETTKRSYYANIQADFVNIQNQFLQALALGRVVPANEQPERTAIAKTEAKIGFKIGNQHANKEGFTVDVNDKRTTADVTDRKVGERICENCGKPFVYRAWNQRFCCSDCRVQAWEAKTGQKVKFGKK